MCKISNGFFGSLLISASFFFSFCLKNSDIECCSSGRFIYKKKIHLKKKYSMTKREVSNNLILHVPTTRCEKEKHDVKRVRRTDFHVTMLSLLLKDTKIDYRRRVCSSYTKYG